jgi:uncharacterized protein YkwD
MNFVDLILIMAGLFSIWIGWRKGFIHASSDLIVWIGSLLIAFVGYPYLARWAEKLLGQSAWILPVCFLLCLLLAGSCIAWVLRLLLSGLSPAAERSRTNQAMGILPGMVNAYISASIVALLLLTLPFGDGLSAQAEKSVIAARLTPPAEWLQEKLSPVFNEAVKRSMTKLTVEPGSDETVKLPFHTEKTKERPDLEAKMLVMVNRERTERGLKPLVADTAMRQVALAHSRDMFARGYFSHYTPEKKDPFDRMRKARIRYVTAGENLALARTIAIAHTGLMNSPGHRANILNPSYGRLGIGIADGGMHGLIISQEFRN